METAILPDGRAFVISRHGKAVLVDPSASSNREVADLATASDGDAGGLRNTLGLLGIALSPGFAKDRWVYLYYTPGASPPVYRLSRFRFEGDRLTSEKTLLEIPRDNYGRDHTGGSLAFDLNGNLHLSTGDNTDLGGSDKYSPSDMRPGRAIYDAQRTAANTNDLRGKILRIRPLPFSDSENPSPGAGRTYAIPDANMKAAFTHLWPGNLADKVRPEIYAMGLRNPFRLAVHPRKGWVQWGEVGPDAETGDTARGPMGHDEFNLAAKPGFFGWPHSVSFQQAYREFDFQSRIPGRWFDPLHPENRSPNNTGVTHLPPTQVPLLTMDRQKRVQTLRGYLNEDWGRGSVAIGGAFYDATLIAPGDRAGALPPFYHDKLFIAEWTHRWIRVVTLDDAAGLVAVKRFLPRLAFTRIIDLAIGPDGRMYVLEWGHAYQPNDNHAKLVRIDYRGKAEDPAACGPTGVTVKSSRDAFSPLSGWSLRRLERGLALPIPPGARGLAVYSLDGRALVSEAWETGEAPGHFRFPSRMEYVGLGWMRFYK